MFEWGDKRIFGRWLLHTHRPVVKKYFAETNLLRLFVSIRRVAAAQANPAILRGLQRGRIHAPGIDIKFARLRQQQNLLVDRKSTRLNSSHSQISYAVFCLK